MIPNLAYAISVTFRDTDSFLLEVSLVWNVRCLPAGSFTFDRPLKWYVPPHRVGFLCLFGLKTGIHFAHFGLGSGMLFEGTTGVYEYLSFQLQMSKKEREICELEMDLNFFTL